MNRALLAMSVPFLAISLTAIALSGKRDPVEARFAAEDCTRVQLADFRGRALRGIEDMALTREGVLILGAYNRQNPELPPQGIYWLPFDSVVPGEVVAAIEMPGLREARGDLYPHGLAIDRSGGRLAFVNRSPQDGAAEVVWGTLGPDGFSESGRWSGEGSCRANDVAYRGAELLVTIDRGACGFSVSDLMPGAETGRVVSIGFGREQVVAEGLAFPNGIELSNGELVVAETRGERVTRLPGRDALEMPGGPDNLTHAGLGQIVAAVHPDLFRLWLYRAGAVDDSPSRVVQFDPARNVVEVLFDDPYGEQFSAATVAIHANGRLVIGSAQDTGLLVCGAGRGVVEAPQG